jgi:hypothetical protein
MDTIRFYDELPAMECFSGDTLPEFVIHPDGEGVFSQATMVMLIEEQKVPGAVALAKQCIAHVGSGPDMYFTVQLTSTDTAQLCGTYRLHFIMTLSSTDYEKLTGTLHVRQMVRGTAS